MEQKKTQRQQTDQKLLLQAIQALAKTIEGSERRLDQKIEASAESMKEYVDSRFRHVQGEIKGIRVDMTVMQSGMKAMALDIKELQKGMKGVRSDIDGLRLEMKDVWSAIKDIRGEMKDIRGEIKDIRIEIKEIRADVKDIRESLFRLDKKVDVSVKGLVGLIERRSGETAKLEYRVDDHERRIAVLERA